VARGQALAIRFTLALLFSLWTAAAVSAQSVSRVTLGLDNPVGLAFDAKGNLYIANGLSDLITKAGPLGQSMAIFASGFKAPQAVAFDPAGNLYVAGGADTAIIRVTPAGSGSIFATGFSRPQALAFDKSGTLYVADQIAGTVSKVSAAGKVTVFAKGFSLPTALAFDANGNLYVANGLAGTVAKVTPGAVISVFAEHFAEPAGLAFDAKGNLYVAEVIGGQVSKVTPGGAVSVFAANLGPTAGLAFDAHGNLFVGGFHGAVTRISPAGAAKRFLPILDRPAAMVRDAKGNVLVANSGSNEIDKVAPNGSVTRLASGFSELHGLALDKAGNLYAADAGANLVKKITAGGGVTTFAGIDSPRGMVIDAKGNLYVASITEPDGTQGEIDRISPAGKVSRFTYFDSTVPDVLAIDSKNNLYFSNAGHRVYQIKADGSGGDTYVSGLGNVVGLSTDAGGNIYVADAGTGQVLEIPPNLAIATVVASDLRLNGLLYGDKDKIYIAGTDNAVSLLDLGKSPGSITRTKADQNYAYFLRNSTQPIREAGCAYNPAIDMVSDYDPCWFGVADEHIPTGALRLDLGFNAEGAITSANCFEPPLDAVFTQPDAHGIPFQFQMVRSQVSEASPPLIAAAQVVHTAANTPVTIDLTNGSAGLPASSAQYGAPAGGTVKGFPGTTITFTPAKNFAGLASFRYKLGTGTCASGVATAYIGVGSTLAAPAITALTPASGPRAGGGNVTIAGRNLLLPKAPAQVMFGTTAAKIVSSSATKIVVQAPANFAGTIYVTVATPGGASAHGPAGIYTYK